MTSPFFAHVISLAKSHGFRFVFVNSMSFSVFSISRFPLTIPLTLTFQLYSTVDHMYIYTQYPNIFPNITYVHIYRDIPHSNFASLQDRICNPLIYMQRLCTQKFKHNFRLCLFNMTLRRYIPFATHFLTSTSR